MTRFALGESPVATGPLTFLFTDIEASTQHWQRDRAGMGKRLQLHDDLVRAIVVRHSGECFKMVGDACCAAFAAGSDAVAAALDIQHSLRESEWNRSDPIRVRIGIHTGTPDRRDGDYFGPPLNCVARVLAAGHGGQILMTRATVELVRDDLSREVELIDLGEHRLKDIVRDVNIFQVQPAGSPREFPPLRTADRGRVVLPVPTSAFIGRAEHAPAVADTLADPAARIVTITGPGGVGKTRLAIEVAHASIGDFPDGVFMIEAAPMQKPAQVITAIRTALDVPAGGPGDIALAAHRIASGKVLLVVDNLEHLTGCGSALVDLLRFCPGLKILTTSRVALRVNGEHVYDLPPMTVSAPREGDGVPEAVALFVERARAAHHDFALSDPQIQAVVEICQRLDGLPLAIELAAARTRLFSVDDFLRRITASDGNLSRVLGSAPRDTHERSQTLEATIEWSFRLLESNEANLLLDLAVFRGGWDLDAVETICSDRDVLSGLEELIANSLVQQTRTGSTTRYTLLETIREFCQGNVAEARLRELQGRHAAYYGRAIETATGVSPDSLEMPKVELSDRDSTVVPPEWLSAIEPDYENFVSAIARLEQDDRGRAARIATLLAPYILARGCLVEGEFLLKRVTSPAGEDQAVDGAALMMAAAIALEQNRVEEAEGLLRRSADVCRRFELVDVSIQARSRLAFVWLMMGESDRGTVLFEQACADARRLGHANAYLLNLGGIIFMRAADFERADRYFQEAAEVLRGRHQPHSWVLAINRGWLSWLQGDDSAAGEVARELYTLLEGKGVPWRTDALSLNFLARACTAEGRLAEAVDLLVTSLSLSAEKRQEWFSALSLEGLARILGNRSRGLEGATLMGAAASMRERAGTPFSPGEAKRSVEETDHTRDECSPDLWAAAFAAGQSLAFDDAVQLALSSFPPAPDHLLYPFPTS